MLTVDALRTFGAKVDEGLARCMNNDAFYLRLVKMAVEDDASFDRLAQAVEAGDRHAAFEAAHDLKGVLGNLSLTPI
ncbi:MAG: Hpt domain-containing protein [Fretibacterium sp.]|nr:Hpt domain-containing protein [Fretibacterium sp.]